MPALRFRPLDPAQDRAAVLDLLTEAQDYYLLWLGRAPDDRDVEEVFTAGPPGCDPADSHRIGLYVNDQLSGVAELSFGFPTGADAYLGLMILAPRARGEGIGEIFYDHIEALARKSGAARLYLGVLEANPRGRAFWERMGFEDTGVTREDAETGHRVHRLVKDL